MKRAKSKCRDAMIDKYYNEDFDKGCIDDAEFNKELNESLDKMKAIDDIDCKMDIDILDIIEKAEVMKDKKKKTIENTLFIVVSLSIFAIFALAAVLEGTKFIVIYQLVIVTLMPFVLIPISISKVKEGSGYDRN